MDDLTELSTEDLAAARVEAREALDALFAIETAPSPEQLAEAKELGQKIEAIDTLTAEREQAAADAQSEWDGLKDQFTDAPPEPEVEEEDEEDEEPAEAAAEEVTEEEPEPVVASASKVKAVARRTKRPAPPAATESSKVSIIAAANTDFSAGSTIDIPQVGQALQSKVAGFPAPQPEQAGSDTPMQFYPVAKFQVEYPEEYVIDRNKDHMAVLSEVAKESRLPGGSLVAAGGWCAPSETLYDFCEGETLDGLISLPEVNVKRGGINFTKGPQFSDFYGTPFTAGAGFLQTEAQAIAGTDKVCYDITCPPFTEVRLDAVGLCIRVPILTDAAYPELTRRVISGQMTAQQHRISANIISRIVTLSGAARVIALTGSTVADSLEGLELLADQRREQFRLGLSQSLEVILPFWVKGMYRSDLGRRMGVGTEAITDAMLMTHFAARNLAVQFVYGWQQMSSFPSPPAEVYPATYQALLYPAGTFVVGKADVINLSAVYDAASLVENLYTGLFTEQGLLVAEMCYDSDLVTLPVCNAGRTGAANLTCA